MKTSKHIILISILVAFASCATQSQYVQIAQTKAVEKNGLAYNEENRCYEYSDTACTITYNMWSIGGKLQYTITNQTDHILYIDNNRSFLVKDGISLLAASQTPKENFIELVAIAPHSTTTIAGPNLNSELWLSCDLDRKPVKNHPTTMAFTKDDTPMLFRSVICYRLSNDTCHLVDNGFYISRVTNYRATDLYENKNTTKTNCINVEGYNSTSQQTYYLYLFTPSNGFKNDYVK